jgi:hypothetical protein
MRKLSIWKFAALAGLAASAPAIAGSDKVLYGPVPDWVPPAPAPEVAGNPAGGAARVVYNEVETRLDDSGSHTFTGYRVALLAPEALAAGNINLVWNPSSATETVHYLRVHRDGQVIDVLKTSPFAVYQREGKLEQAMLDGLLTANLQIPGLRVGDEIEFAATLDERDPVFPASEYGALFLADQVAPGTYRLGLQWSPDREPKIQVTSALQPAIERTGTRVSATLTDPAAFVAPTDAPARYAMGRLIEYSNFDGWADISRTFFPLYRDAAKLAAVPGLDERIAAIASEHPDAKGRARAALALVQQSVRYVYTGMNGGNWIPAPAATTWDRRFADCKGVTALLLGILDRLEIAAEPVLVASNAASPIDRLLPSPAAFDHVLVRIVVDGKPFWLDGTRMGDDRLLTNQEIAFRWGLPVSAAGSALEPIAHSAPRMPSDVTFLDIDARAGVESKAKVHMVEVTRGDAAVATGIALRAMPPATAAEQLKHSFEGGWLSPTSVAWTYNRDSGALEFTIDGELDLDWETDQTPKYGTIAQLYLPQGGFSPPNRMERPADQDQSAPFTNDLSRYVCDVTRVRLPEMPGKSWSLTARKIDQTIGGVAYYRLANLSHSTVEMVRTSRTVKEEIPPDEAAASNRLIKDFDNSKAQVFTSPDKFADTASQVVGKLPDLDKVDWGNAADFCLAH